MMTYTRTLSCWRSTRPAATASPPGSRASAVAWSGRCCPGWDTFSPELKANVGQLLHTGNNICSTSVKANASLAWASAGEAKAVISTWSSSLRWLCFGSVEFLSSSSCCLFLIEPRPSTAIFVIVSSCSCFNELPRGPSSFPTKLNWNWGEGKSKDDRRLPWGAPSLGWTPWPTAWQAARCRRRGDAALGLVDGLPPALGASLKKTNSFHLLPLHTELHFHSAPLQYLDGYGPCSISLDTSSFCWLASTYNDNNNFIPSVGLYLQGLLVTNQVPQVLHSSPVTHPEKQSV